MRISRAVLSLSCLVGCVEGLPDESSTNQARTTHNRIGVNDLKSAHLFANKLAASKLAVAQLADNAYVLDDASAGDLLATADGRQVLLYTISCAMPLGTTVYVANPVIGEPEFYFGTLGLAPQWLDAPLDSEGKGWVSACLFARVNGNNQPVPISLRGASPALFTEPGEDALYPLQEGAFYGNYFTKVDEPILWFACRGHAQAASETGGLIDRDCTEADPGNPGYTQCGFIDQGECFDDVATKKPDGACQKETDGVYGHCDGLRKGGPEKEVITTYVEISAP